MRRTLLRRLILTLTLAVVPACATMSTTPMEDCDFSPGCDKPPATPEAQVRERAATELVCQAAQIKVQQIDHRESNYWSTWDARGCGRATVYEYHDTSSGEDVARHQPIVSDPFASAQSSDSSSQTLSGAPSSSANTIVSPPSR